MFNQAWLARRVAMLEQLSEDQGAPDDPLTTRVARQSDCGTEYRRWMNELGHPPLVERKAWEWAAMGRALDAAGCLGPDRTGLGFAVGTEPLAGAFAARGCKILATDLDTADPRADSWAATGQHASGRTAAGVSFRPVDMTSIPSDLVAFDFVWSACAMEHLGTLQAGFDFIEEAMGCLRPGGWAVHTTEYNVGDEVETIERGPTVFYRRSDILRLESVARAGHRLLPTGAMEKQWGGSLDAFIDIPPHNNVSLILGTNKVKSTSLILIVQAAGAE